MLLDVSGCNFMLINCEIIGLCDFYPQMGLKREFSVL